MRLRQHLLPFIAAETNESTDSNQRKEKKRGMGQFSQNEGERRASLLTATLFVNEQNVNVAPEDDSKYIAPPCCNNRNQRQRKTIQQV